ncbi:hypothetical protein [Rubritalea marina]|uniref:hypothetical protein n=1 Tax=Rubritalea marina TaxID=361055 RepID=UPI000372DB7A|nr:hypothetical protein [Rubritalea marina]
MSNAKCIPFVAVIFVMLFQTLVLSGSASAREQPTEVKIAYVVLDIDAVSSADQSFTLNVFFRAQWHDPEEAHDGEKAITKELLDVWHPRIQIANRKKAFNTMDEVVTIQPDGTVTYIQRIWGGFSQIMNLADFPFDSQKFQIHIVSVGHQPSEVQFVLDEDVNSGISEKFSLPDWDVTDHKAWAENGKMYREMEEVPMFTISLEAKRYSWYYMVKVILPLVLIVAMSWIVFWIDPEQSSTQIGVATTSMLTLIAYRFTIDRLVPAVSYLTRMDEFILSSTILVFITLCEAVTTSVLTKHGKAQLATTMDKWFRIIIPLSFALLTYHAFFS